MRKNLSRLLAFLFVSFLYGATMAVANFQDVPKTHPNYDAINYVQENKIVSGYSDGTFKADNKIVRAEFIKIVTAATFDSETIDDCLTSSFQDTPRVFHDVPTGVWFTKYVCIAKKEKIIAGYPDGTFKPSQNISFSEASKIIATAFKLPVTTTDPWYKGYVEALAERKSIPVSIKAFDQEITRGEMTEQIYRIRDNIQNKESKTYNQLAGIETVDASSKEPVIKEFDMTVKQFEFNPSTIKVKVGDKVRLKIKNLDSDVTHGFEIPSLKVKAYLNPDEVTVVEFSADKKGSFTFECSVFCGEGHFQMTGTLIVE